MREHQSRADLDWLALGVAVLMAVPVSFPAWYPRRMPVLERVRERLERIARASSPGFRLVLELLAAVFLRM